MAETITKQQFTEKAATAVAAILKKHKLPDKPQGGTIRNWELWGFILRELELESKNVKEVNAIAAEVSHALGGKPAIYGDGGHILVGFVGKPNASVFLA